MDAGEMERLELLEAIAERMAGAASAGEAARAVWYRLLRHLSGLPAGRPAAA